MKLFICILFLLVSFSALGGYPKGEDISIKVDWSCGGNTTLTATTGTINIVSLPANALVKKVSALVKTPVAGSSSEIVGDGDDDNGYLLDSFAATAGFYANDVDDMQYIGAYAKDVDNTATVPKSYFYSSADTIDLKLGSACSAGAIDFFIDAKLLP